MTKLIDPFARPISYLRVSVTDRCDFRCTYCMAEHMQFLPKKDLLTLEELDRLCSTFIRLGVEKLRITGGEPLVRRDIMTFFKTISRHLETGALKELTLDHERLATGAVRGAIWPPSASAGSMSRLTRSIRRSSRRSPAGGGCRR